jgi:hypothetical protein
MRSGVLCGQLPTAKQPKVLIVTDHHAQLPAGRCTLARPIVCAKVSVRSMTLMVVRRCSEFTSTRSTPSPNSTRTLISARSGVRGPQARGLHLQPLRETWRLLSRAAKIGPARDGSTSCRSKRSHRYSGREDGWYAASRDDCQKGWRAQRRRIGRADATRPKAAILEWPLGSTRLPHSNCPSALVVRTVPVFSAPARLAAIASPRRCPSTAPDRSRRK